MRNYPAGGRPVEFRIGVADAVSKTIAYRLIESATRPPTPVRIVCREWKLDSLLAELSAHRLDLVIAGAPMLVPGVDVAVRSRLERWREANKLRPRVVGEFDDSALMKAFGQRGAGIFIGPTVLESEIEMQYCVKALGRAKEIVEEFFAISVERRVTHPCVVAVTGAARERLFVTSDAA